MKTLTNPEQNAKDFESRYKLLYISVTITALIVFGRLWFLQIIKGDELKAYSDRNRVKETKIVAPRGLILDRNEQVLVENLPGFEATITPQYATQLESMALALSKVLNIKKHEILQLVKKSKRQTGLFRPVTIKKNLSISDVSRVKLLTLHHPGLSIRPTNVRSYSMKHSAAQLFGYVGEISKKQLVSYKKKFPDFQFEQGDIIGKSGIEDVWETTIRGYNGIKLNEVDARGRGRGQDPSSASFLGLKQKQARTGNHLVLTIDKDIHEAAFLAMNRDDKIGPRIGALIAMKPNGEILAWVSTPSYDPNVFSTGISTQLYNQIKNDPNKPLRNKVIQDHASPGSTFKPFVALAALQEKIISPSTLIHSPGVFKYKGRPYHDHTRYGYGKINVLEALERSSNVFFYKMGKELGIDNISKYSKLLGIGSRTNINLADERTGLMPTKEWKMQRYGEVWQPGENLSSAIGQGFILTTPLQMAVAYSAIGQEGLVYKPFLVKKIINQDSEVIKEFKPSLVRDASEPSNDIFISKKNFKIVKEGMRRVSNGDHGTARWYKLPGKLEMAGKTGTVQVQAYTAKEIYGKCSERPFKKRHHGWFGAFAPVDKPKITVIVFAEHACHGSSGGAPVVRDVMKAYFKKYHPELLKKKAKKTIKKVTTQ